MNIDGQIQNRLKQLKLAGILETLPVRLKQAEQSNSGYTDFLSTLLEDEYERRQAGSLLKRLKKADFVDDSYEKKKKPWRALTSPSIHRYPSKGSNSLPTVHI